MRLKIWSHKRPNKAEMRGTRHHGNVRLPSLASIVLRPLEPLLYAADLAKHELTTKRELLQTVVVSFRCCTGTVRSRFLSSIKGLFFSIFVSTVSFSLSLAFCKVSLFSFSCRHCARARAGVALIRVGLSPASAAAMECGEKAYAFWSALRVGDKTLRTRADWMEACSGPKEPPI